MRWKLYSMFYSSSNIIGKIWQKYITFGDCINSYVYVCPSFIYRFIVLVDRWMPQSFLIEKTLICSDYFALTFAGSNPSWVLKLGHFSNLITCGDTAAMSMTSKISHFIIGSFSVLLLWSWIFSTCLYSEGAPGNYHVGIKRYATTWRPSWCPVV